MNESEVLSMIAGAEGPNIDFKRELVLDTARSKAELVKDIIAIANSEAPRGYLLIGVDDNKQVVGVSALNEEQIQQIAYRYITPPVILTCELISLSTLGLLSVGIITIKSTNRPHKVVSPIERLAQDEVFIRRGSITTKASPEEIIRMHNDQTQLCREIAQYKRAAEIHLKLGNYSNVIAALSKAIEIRPGSELFLARAEAFQEMQRADRVSDSWQSWGEAALKDIADAIDLSGSPELEARARRMRRQFQGFAYVNYTDTQREQDFEFEKQSLKGMERGKWLCQEVADWGPAYRADDYTISLLHEALESGYHDPEVYFLLAKAYHGSHNYGFALKEIDRLIDAVDDTHEKMVDFLCLRAKILIEMKRYKEARDTLLNAKELDEARLSQCLWIIPSNFEEEILCRCIMEVEFGSRITKPLHTVMYALILALGRSLGDLVTSIDEQKVIEWKTELDYLEKKYPGSLVVIQEIIDKECWEALRTGSPGLEWNLRFPAVTELIQQMQEKNFSFIYGDKRHYVSFVSK